MKKIVIIFILILFRIEFANAQSDDCGCFDMYSKKADADAQQWKEKYANARSKPFEPNHFDKYSSEYMRCLQQCEAEKERKRVIEREKQRQEFEQMKQQIEQRQAQQEVQRKKRQAELQAQMEAQRNRDAKIRAHNEEVKRRNQEIAAHNARVRAEAAERRKQEAERRERQREAEIERRTKNIANPINAGVDKMTRSANDFITMQGGRTDEIRKIDKSKELAKKNKATVRVTGSSMSPELRDFKYTDYQTTRNIPILPMSLTFTESRSPSQQTKEEKKKIKEEAERYTGIYYVIRDSDGNEYFVLDEDDVYTTMENIEYVEEFTSLMTPEKSTFTIDGLDASKGVTEAYDALSSMERRSSFGLVENGKKCTFEAVIIPLSEPIALSSNYNTASSMSQETPQMAKNPEQKPTQTFPKPVEKPKKETNVTPGKTNSTNEKD